MRSRKHFSGRFPLNDPSHISFLDDFPSLKERLLVNGFSMLYSTLSEETGIVFSMWTDRSSADSDLHFAPDAGNAFMILFCRQCGIVEVYGRGCWAKKGSDAQIARQLEPLFPSPRGGGVAD